MSQIYAHSLPGRPQSEWQTQEDYRRRKTIRAMSYEVAILLGEPHMNNLV